jgi:hypothetical protein
VVAHESSSGQILGGYEKDYKYNQALVEGYPLLFEPLTNGDWRIAWVEKIDPPEAVTG